jgi:hypothetical protein
MEYEISDEDVLFDESTNPSLQHQPQDAARRQAPGRPQDPADRRKLQKAELIPEEEEQLA